MCGIAGYYGQTRYDESRVRATLPLMHRRGPDATGQQHYIHAKTQRETVLLHSRLSIIDLDERATQPFKIGPYTLIYNGELYNYVELKEQLEQAGVSFYTTSDTEVLLQAWIQWGYEALDKFEGMWAFAIYHEETGTLVLSRDRFGEKPLYLYRDTAHETLYFGSEIKYLEALSGHTFSVNDNHVCRYLINGYKSLYKQNETFFHNVIHLSPGQVLTISPDGQRQWPYWQPTFEQNNDMSFQEATKGVQERLIRSVEQRLRADVPIAFCLSGGVDSNALVSIAKKALGYDVEGFTIVNEDARYEEMDCIEASIKHLGIRHTPIHLSTTDFLPKLKELIIQHDAPVYTITYYVHWLLIAAMAESGYRISVSGTAADELFSGYFDHHPSYLHTVAGQDSAFFETQLGHWEDHVKPVVRNPFLQNPRLFIEQPFERRHIYLNADGFSELLCHPWSEPFRESIYTRDMLRNRMANELFQEATPVILHEDDLNAMYFSIENRSPYLDRRLFDFANTIPTAHLMREGAAKAVLRESVRGIVADKVLDTKKKVGFNAPISDLINLACPETQRELLADSPIFEYVDKGKFTQLLTQTHVSNSLSKFIFYFISAKLFLETR